MRLRRVVSPAVSLIALACGSGPEQSTTDTAPSTSAETSADATATQTSTSDSGDSTAEESDTSDGETTDGTKFDTMTDSDLDPEDTVCQYVDALFAVDVSGSMTEEITAMSNAMLFQSFSDTLLDAGNGLVDFQLAVMNDLPAWPYYHNNAGTPNFTDCNFSTGALYMSSNSPSFEDEFACIFSAAALGTISVGDTDHPDANTPLPNLDYLQGGGEMPARSAALSVSNPFAQQVNAGFVRDNAVLFVMTISDEDDEVFVNGQLDKNPPMADVVQQMTEIHDALVAAKGGDPKKVVFLGIGAGSDMCVGPYGETVREAEHLKYLASLFEADGQGLFWDICQGNLEAAILEALTIVDQACDEWEPVG